MIATKENRDVVLPRRMRGLQPTLIRQFFERALPDSINFGLGEPDLPTPQFVRDEAARIARDEQNGYTSHPGLPALRDKIAEQYPHLNLPRTGVVVTCGSQEAMTDAFLCAVDEGDEVLLPDPSFPAYDACTRIAEGIPVYYKMPANKEFGFDIEEFRSKITDKTKAAVVISPSNPTGKILTPEDLKQIAKALDGTGIWLISDEIYRDLYFGERPRSASEFYERTIIVSGLSKSLSMTGWRMGWAACKDPEMINAIQVLHGFTTVCTSTITQKASLIAWSPEAEDAKEEFRDVYRKRGKFLVDLFDKELGLKATSPEGAFYTMLDVQSLGDDLAIAEKCLQNRVVTVPGVAFGPEAKGFLRISFCNTEEKMAEGVRRMKEALQL
ncbi:pyridoxal phosphate-dependent aminotransferase [Leptolyngbya sp. 7M]|uniref:pyridoxal phosphate-dependent aminotransferase n=1 Tax=Leptolyngbya sp. 7M TaxID=2812896 RepID=UPI001B8C1688|nr:pyridoxal phosphate-dependent aminotransferase [Leptolyngbya sp. 7M]QYO65231.1 pyridoxal phosphate-dependent aminotransferase [Leptolyngbya sp. 7M]